MMFARFRAPNALAWPQLRRAFLAILGALNLLPLVALAGPPFVTDDPEPVDYGHFEINIAAIGTFASGTRFGDLPGLDINYGAAEDLQLHLGIANAFDREQGKQTRDGYGDTELGIKYRFIQEDEEGVRPQVSLYPNLEIPTGSRTRDVGTGEARFFLPIWLQKSFDGWTTYGGGGYWINPPNGFTAERNYWFAGWTLLRHVDDQLMLGGEVFWQSPSGERAGTGAGYNLGGEYDLDDTHHVLFSAGRNLEDPSQLNNFSFYLGLQLVL